MSWFLENRKERVLQAKPTLLSEMIQKLLSILKCFIGIGDNWFTRPWWNKVTTRHQFAKVAIAWDNRDCFYAHEPGELRSCKDDASYLFEAYPRMIAVAAHSPGRMYGLHKRNHVIYRNKLPSDISESSESSTAWHCDVCKLTIVFIWKVHMAKFPAKGWSTRSTNSKFIEQDVGSNLAMKLLSMTVLK